MIQNLWDTVLGGKFIVIQAYLSHNLKRYMHPNVLCGTIYNSQVMEAT